MKTAIVTDSTCYLTDKEIADNHITVVPIPVVIDGKSYDEGVDITTEEFYQNYGHLDLFQALHNPHWEK